MTSGEAGRDVYALLGIEVGAQSACWYQREAGLSQ
jgi:hypothetical protein